jgi:hypothetical protein
VNPGLKVPDPAVKDNFTYVMIAGQKWEPIACGEHNSVGVSERGSNLPAFSPVGFQASCEACKHQLADTVSYAQTHSTV